MPVSSRDELRRLHFINALFAHVTGHDLYLANQIKGAITFSLAELAAQTAAHPEFAAKFDAEFNAAAALPVGATLRPPAAPRILPLGRRAHPDRRHSALRAGRVDDRTPAPRPLSRINPAGHQPPPRPHSAHAPRDAAPAAGLRGSPSFHPRPDGRPHRAYRRPAAAVFIISAKTQSGEGADPRPRLV